MNTMSYKGYLGSVAFSVKDNVFFGKIEGINGLVNFEGESVKELTDAFHEAVDDYLGRKSFIRPEKRNVWIPIVVVAAVLFLALVTCPDKSKHTKVLSEQLNSAVTESFAGEGSGLEAVGMLLSGPIIKTVLNNYLVVDDYFLFSIGRFSFQGEESTVSFGAFGHVFTSSREKMKETLKEQLK